MGELRFNQLASSSDFQILAEPVHVMKRNALHICQNAKIENDSQDCLLQKLLVQSHQRMV